MAKKIDFSREDIETMKNLRRRGVSCVKIGRRFNVSRQTVHNYTAKELEDEGAGIVPAVKIYNETRFKKPTPRHKTVRDYDFLQYIRPVMRWGEMHTGMSRGRLEGLLFLYSKGLFTFEDFHQYFKIIELRQRDIFNYFLENNWIKVWRYKRKGEGALYEVSNRGKQVCDRMHKFLTGETKIPESDLVNPIAKNEGNKRVNNYYMQVIKQMNRDKRDS